MAQITVEIKHWLLTDDTVMHKCLHDMSSNNFRGQVRVQPEPPPQGMPEGLARPVWDLELNDNAHFDRPPVQAVIGQVVVFFGGVLQVITPGQFTDQFGVTP